MLGFGSRAAGARGKNIRVLLWASRQELDRLPIAVQRADVDVGLSALHTHGLSAVFQIGVHQCADILVLLFPPYPECVQLVQNRTGQLERAPNPM